MATSSYKTTPPAASATVILVRQLREEIQVYLIKRHSRSAFMPDYFVFPGGVVDSSDGRETDWQKHVDLDPVEIDRRLGGDLTGSEVLPYAVAAIREMFEETGVLLIDRPGLSGWDLEKIRKMQLTSGWTDGWLLRQAHAGSWTLALSALLRWSHWITPLQMSRRYDTRFFLSVLPAEQVCRPDGREATDGIWINPAKGLAANQSGDVPLSPPTLIVLNELRAHTSLDGLLASTRQRPWGPALQPRLLPLEKGGVIIEPWDAEYGHGDIALDYGRLEDKLLPLGEPFSRLWQREGLWRPIGA